jgi:hypothetical protein
MKRSITLLGLSLMFLATVAFAQREGEGRERRVRFTQGPNIINISGESATMNWATYGNRADRVVYRETGSDSEWRSAYGGGEGTSHTVRLTGLRPRTTYEWQIVERDGDLIRAGQFQTARNRHGRAPDVLAGREDDDRDHDRDGDEGNRVRFYRGVNREGGHKYSPSSDDITPRGYRSEGAVWSLMSSRARGTTPLYRLVSAQGDALLTADPNERDSAIGQGYRDQGITGYIPTSQWRGTVPLFRLYNAGSGQHFYTTSEHEREEAARSGMNDEGVTGYVWP